MPVHAHDAAKRLKPEWVAEAGQQLRGAVMIENALGDRRAQLRHSFREPSRYTPAVERKVCESGAFHCCHYFDSVRPVDGEGDRSLTVAARKVVSDIGERELRAK